MACIPGMTVMYERNNVSAEKMELVHPIIHEYVRSNGVRLDRTPIYFLEITGNATKDYRRLRRRARKSPVFVSQLTSTLVQYLQQIFFDAHPETIQISSVSTAVGLDGANLLRLQAPDADVQKIYVHSARSSAVIIYQVGIYYENLSRAIMDGLAAANIPSIRLLREEWNLQTINDFVTDDFTMIFVNDDPLTYVEQMRVDPTINLKSFNLLFSDAASQQPTDDPVLLAYLNEHSALAIQTFIDYQQLAIYEKYEALINNPAHPVSLNISLLFQALDWAGLCLSTKTRHRLTRTDYLSLYLDRNLHSTSEIYGGYAYVPTGFRIAQFYFIADGQLSVGENVNTISSKYALSRPRESKREESKIGFCHDVGICVLYNATRYDDDSAERTAYVKPILQKYIRDNGIIINRNRLTYLGITADPVIDRNNLMRVSRKHKVFLSAVGTGVVKALNTIFFSDRLDCIHLNTYSNASSLSAYPNLARYQSPTSSVSSIFAYYIRQRLSSGGNLILVIVPGTYPIDMATEIRAAVPEIPATIVFREEVTMTWLNANTDSSFVMVLVLDVIMDLIQLMMADPTINRKSFQILMTDSAALSLPTTVSETAYLQSKDALLIQQYVSPRQEAIAVEYQSYIDDPALPVSPILAYFLAAFDWSILVTNTRNVHRLTRETYQVLQLDSHLNNSANIFGAYTYVLAGLAFNTYWFVYLGATFRRVPVE